MNMNAKRIRQRALVVVSVFSAVILITALYALPRGGWPAYADDGGPHPGTFKTWDLKPTVGFDPHETIDDVDGLTVHVGAPAMVTAMENLFGVPPCGLLFWNPDTNTFKAYGVTGGFQFALDLDRRAPSGAPLTFGGGDVWATVNGGSGFSPYMNFRGSDNFRRWPGISAVGATGIRVHPTNGKVYFGNFVTPGQIIELDPATNTVRKWTTDSKPYFVVVDDTFVYATGVTGSGQPDQILRLNPATGELKRWNLPGGGFQSSISFGTPNTITKDLEGSIWFTESASDRVGRLRGGPDNIIGTADDVIDEYTKAGLDNPHAIASSGAGATLQDFFTEATAQKVSVHTVNSVNAAPSSTTVAPTTATLTPTTSTVTPVDFIPPKKTVTITPVTTPVMSTNGNAIDRFPIPPGTSNPTGMTRVAFPNTVLGSMEGSDHVFRFESEIIIAPPPTSCTITCPADVTQCNDPGQCGAIVTYPAPTTSGICDTVTCSPASGSFFPVGATTVTCMAGTSGPSCSFTVTVNDCEAPVVTCSVAQSSLWPPNHDLVNVGLAISATDNCDSNPTVSVQVFADEDDEEPTGDGNHSPDAKNIGPGTLRLRSERKGDADGRVYLIVIKATDAAGNVQVCCQTVVVPHSQSPEAIASVNAQAAAAQAFCLANGGAPPPGYFVIGDGPIIGPKQ